MLAAGGLESAARPEGDRPVVFPAFDGLRAIAVFSVVVTHVSFLTGANGNHVAGGLFARMDIGVAIFFLISGFLLYRPFAGAHLDGRPGPAVLPFLRRRALRIFPAYWLALTIVLLVSDSAAAQMTDLPSLLRFYSLLHIYDAERVLGPISQSWSLGTEISFYAFLPLYAALLAKRGTTPEQRVRAQLAGLAALYAGSVAFRLAALAFDWPHNGMLSTWLVSTTDYFALGMLLAVGSLWWRHRTPRLLDHPALPVVSWAVAAALFLFVSYGLDIPRTVIDYTPRQQMMRQFLYGLTGFFLLVPAVFGDQDRGLVRRLLRSRAFVLAGLVSYGIYLWHNFFLEKVLALTGTAPFTGGFGRVLLAVVALTLVVATASYVLVEKPALRWKERRRPAPVTAE